MRLPRHRGPATLRARLLLGALALVAAGLGASDAVASAELHHFLLARVDQQLAARAARIRRQLDRGILPTPARAGDPAAVHDFLALLGPSGQVLASLPASGPDGAALPVPVAVGAHLAAGAARGDVTVGGSAARPAYRLRVVGAPAGSGLRYPPGGATPVRAVAVGVPLDDVAATVAGLDRIEVVVSAAVLAAAVLVGLAVLRLGLHPLAAMAASAQAIAAGQRDQRLPVSRREAELGRLALTLNRAFDERAASEERLRRFVADASHELRTPLTTVRAWAGLYLAGGVVRPAELDTAMRRIDSEAARMGRLVQDLLDLARAGTLAPAPPAPVDVAALAAELVADLGLLAPDRRIDLDLGPPGTWVLGRAEDLRRAVRNLLANAVGHTPPGSPVQVQLRHAPAAPGSWVELAVADRGPGVPAELAGSLFEPFVRADVAGSSCAGGTGLGLAIARAVVAAHGGTIALAERAGGGAVFTVRLPAAPAPPSSLRAAGRQQ